MKPSVNLFVLVFGIAGSSALAIAAAAQHSRFLAAGAIAFLVFSMYVTWQVSVWEE